MKKMTDEIVTDASSMNRCTGIVFPRRTDALYLYGHFLDAFMDAIWSRRLGGSRLPAMCR